MLDDRFYMREGGYSPYRSITVWILIINVAVFLVQSIFRFYVGVPLEPYFALSRDGLMRGYLWQLITFQFMHGGIFHLLINCLMIYMFGRSVESTLGRSSYLRFYLLSGVAGGLFQIVGGWLLPGNIGTGWVVGASAGLFGLVAAFATLHPEQPLSLLVAFILPVTMRAKYLLYIFGGIAVLGIAFPGDNIAHAAHLGGLVFGVVYVKWRFHNSFSWFSRMRLAVPRPLVRATMGRRGPWRGQSDADLNNMESEEFISREVDPILDKISAQGIHSLTARERQILEAARKKMARRP